MRACEVQLLIGCHQFQISNYAKYNSFILSQALIVQDVPLASLFGVSVITHTLRHTVGLLWTTDKTVAKASTYTGQHNI
jgi:hypothetical protein